ncbi:acyltransferase family protein [uncultured Bacteroides sp.]|uniref:acyltransferase family protein n=1 Tax=uncultured Bacteroides sp. TaxID=162156 RepID=UPI002AABD943|nr:acyltransferase family protein [uncultured Bacteroides sp.]
MNSRIEYIDRLKGFAILLVVIGHFIECNVVKGYLHPLYSFIYFFHMPLFMFISGYVAKKYLKVELAKPKEAFTFINKKIRSLIIPYLTWSLLIPMCFLSYNFKFDLFSRFEYLIFHHTYLWFLTTLFYLSLLFLVYEIISKILLKFKGGRILCITILYITTMFLYHIFPNVVIKSIFGYFPFYFLGVIIAQFKRAEDLYCNKIAFGIFTIAFLIIPVHFNYFETEFYRIIKAIVSFAAIPTIYYLSRFMRWNTIIDNQIQLWGRNSLVIYVTQWNLLHIFTINLPLYTSTFSLILVSFILSLFIGYACILIGNVIKYSPIIDLLIYGRKSK